MRNWFIIGSLFFCVTAQSAVNFTTGGTVTDSTSGYSITIPPGSSSSGQFDGGGLPSGYTLGNGWIISYWFAFNPEGTGYIVMESTNRGNGDIRVNGWSNWYGITTEMFQESEPPVNDQVINIDGEFMTPEQWAASKILSATLQLWVKGPDGQWYMVSEFESNDGSYSWEFESDASFEYEVRLGNYTVDLGDGLPPVTLPGNEVVASGNYSRPENNPPPIVNISSPGNSSLGGSTPAQAGGTVSTGSGGSGGSGRTPTTNPIYSIPGTNGNVHYYNPNTGQVTTYPTGGSGGSGGGGPVTVSPGLQNAIDQQNLSDVVGKATFDGITGNQTVPTAPEGLGSSTAGQGEAIAEMAETTRSGILGAINGVPAPSLPGFGSSLAWSATIPYLGPISFDLTPHASIIASWRDFLKFLLAVLAWIWTIQIIRGSTV